MVVSLIKIIIEVIKAIELISFDSNTAKLPSVIPNPPGTKDIAPYKIEV